MKKHLRTLPFGIVLAAALAAGRCGSSAVTSVTGPTATRCQASVTNSSSTFGPSGGTGTLSISIDRECSWSASTPVSWIQLTSAASGQGAGSVSYRVAANPDPVARRSAIAAAETEANIAQDAAPCEYSLSGPPNALPAPGGSTTIDIRTNAACSWSAKPSGAWATVQPTSGSGTATITVTAAANTGAARTLTITVGSASVDVQQQAAAPGAPPVPPPQPAPAPSPSPGPGPAPTPGPDPAPTPGPPPPPLPSTPVDLTGKVSELSGRCPAVTFALDVFTIEATKNTTYSGGGCKDLKDGTDVEVHGGATGTTVTASSIAIKKERH